MSWNTKTIKLNNKSNNGQAIQLPSIVANKGIQIKANKSNDDSIWISPNEGSFDDAFPLDGMDTILMDVANMNEIWIKTTSITDVRLHLLVMNK